METKPLTQEEANKFNEIVAAAKREEKDEILKNIKVTVGEKQVEYIRSVINKQ